MRRDVLIYGLAVLLSLVGHAGIFEGLGRAARDAPPPLARAIELAVYEPPPPPPKPRELPPPPPKPRVAPVDLTAMQKLPPPESPPPPAQEAAPDAEVARPVFGVTMSSVVRSGSGSGFTVRVGNTLMKEPEPELTPPEEVKAYAPVPLSKVTKLPRKIGECEAPEGVLRLGIEGKVRLEVLVLETGEVGEVIVTSGISPAVDAAVVAALERCRFVPAQLGGRDVPTRIPYTYSFYLED